MNQKEKNNIEFEIKFYEGIVERSPDFVEALSALGDLYTQNGQHEKGLDIDKRLTRMRPTDGTVLYNLACSYSLLGEIEKSFESIKRSLELGYNELDYIQEDDDLKNLRQDKNFQQYFSSIWEDFLKSNPQPRMQKMFKDE